MELTVHTLVLLVVFVMAAVLGAVVQKTNFCTMGAVSDWVNMGDTGRLRSWLFAMAVAVAGVALLEASGTAVLGRETFPPYRTQNFAWIRYIVGGLLFGVGMTLGSGCGNKVLVRLGAGNLKSAVVLATGALFAYLMLWTEFYAVAFHSWMAPTALSLQEYGIASQSFGDLLAWGIGSSDLRLSNAVAAFAVVVMLGTYALASRDFRSSADHVLGSVTVGAAVVGGWYLTAGELGRRWKEFAEFAAVPPSRVEIQSFTFISPMGDSLRYLMASTDASLINFGLMALSGVIAGSFAYAVATQTFRIEWFKDKSDFSAHAAGGVLMGVGGVLAMGCTIGQGITGVSTLALGSLLAFVAIVAGAAATMKFQYWLMLRCG